MSIYERTGELPAMLKERPSLPDLCRPAWEAFTSLHKRRGWMAGGTKPVPERLSYLELDAFNRLTKSGLLPWEIRAVEKADDAFFEVRASYV